MTLTHETWCPPTAVPGLDEEPNGPGDLHISSSKAGFTTVVSAAFGPDGLLYVLELSDAAGFPTPGAGRVVRLRHNGEIEDVVTGLVVPTAMTSVPMATCISPTSEQRLQGSARSSRSPSSQATERIQN
jgi:hypothetical protein